MRAEVDYRRALEGSRQTYLPSGERTKGATKLRKLDQYVEKNAFPAEYGLKRKYKTHECEGTPKWGSIVHKIVTRLVFEQTKLDRRVIVMPE